MSNNKKGSVIALTFATHRITAGTLSRNIFVGACCQQLAPWRRRPASFPSCSSLQVVRLPQTAPKRSLESTTLVGQGWLGPYEGENAALAVWPVHVCSLTDAPSIHHTMPPPHSLALSARVDAGLLGHAAAGAVCFRYASGYLCAPWLARGVGNRGQAAPHPQNKPSPSPPHPNG